MHPFAAAALCGAMPSIQAPSAKETSGIAWRERAGRLAKLIQHLPKRPLRNMLRKNYVDLRTDQAALMEQQLEEKAKKTNDGVTGGYIAAFIGITLAIVPIPVLFTWAIAFVFAVVFGVVAIMKDKPGHGAMILCLAWIGIPVAWLIGSTLMTVIFGIAATTPLMVH